MAFEYAKEIERVKESLSKADPLSEDYSRGLATISTLRWLREAEATGSDVECFQPDITFIKDKEEPTPEPEPVKEAEFSAEEPTPFPDPVPVQEPVAEAKTWTKAEVREKLAELKKQGKDLKELFKGFGAAKLSDVKEEDYGKLMESAEAM